MVAQTLSNQLDSIGQILAIMGIFVSAFLIYTKLVIERGLFPPVEFYLKYRVHGEQDSRIIIEIMPILKNKGTSILVVKNLRIRVRYLLRNDPIKFRSKSEGRLDFLRSPDKDMYLDSLRLQSFARESEDSSGFQMLPHDTFIKPGVKQIYTLITFIPSDASYVLLHSTFDYDKKTSLLQRYSLSLAHHLGLINYTLKNIFEPHSCETAFRVKINETNGKIDTSPK